MIEKIGRLKEENFMNHSDAPTGENGNRKLEQYRQISTKNVFLFFSPTSCSEKSNLSTVNLGALSRNSFSVLFT